MFFDDEEIGSSQERYNNRKKNFASKLEHHVWWLLHNCVAHPILGIFPNTFKSVDFHSLTSDWLNNNKIKRGYLSLPKITDQSCWVLHNVIAHTLIGIFPCRLTFEFHDKTAEKMNVKGWV